MDTIADHFPHEDLDPKEHLDYPHHLDVDVAQDLADAYCIENDSMRVVKEEYDLSHDEWMTFRQVHSLRHSQPTVVDPSKSIDEAVDHLSQRQKRQATERKAKQRHRRQREQAARQWWQAEAALERAAGVFAESGYEPPKPRLRLTSAADTRGGLVLNLQDLHIGLWGTGYVKNLQQRFKSLVNESMRLRRIEEVFFVVGGDLVHVDTASGTTTAGTQLEHQMVPHEALAEAIRFVVWCVDYLRALGVDVTLAPVRGNHDRMMSVSAALAVGQRFHETEGVDMLAIKERQYVVYEDHLLCLTHGDMSKRAVRELPQTIQHEARSVMGSTTRTALFTGHLHHTVIADKKGTIHYQCPTPVPADGYHTKEAYVGARKLMQAVVLTPDSGADQILHA